MFEEYLNVNDTPLIALNVITNHFEHALEDDFKIFTGQITKDNAYKIIAIVFIIKLVTNYLIKQRKIYNRIMKFEKFKQ